MTDRKNTIKETVKGAFGFLPNLMDNLIDANPAVAEFYLKGAEALGGGNFSEKERQAAFLAVSALNGCKYCGAAHGKMAIGAGLTEDQIKAIFSGKDTNDDRLNSLARAARLIVEKRGWLDDSELSSLEAKGVSKSDLTELVGIAALKTITNYFNHINKTVIDEAFEDSPLAACSTDGDKQACCAC